MVTNRTLNVKLHI